MFVSSDADVRRVHHRTCERVVDGRFLSSAEANAGVRGTVRRRVVLAVCGVVAWAWLWLPLHTNRRRPSGVRTAASEGLPMERVVICDTRHVTSLVLSVERCG